MSSGSGVAFELGSTDGDGLIAFFVVFGTAVAAFLLTPLLCLTPSGRGIAATGSNACTRADLRRDMVRLDVANLMLDARMYRVGVLQPRKL